MKGLLYKEIVLSKQWLIFLACLEAVFSAVVIFVAGIDGSSDPGKVMTVHIIIAFAMYFLTGVLDDAYFSHDEKSKWSIFVSATPGAMKEQILCKYYVILLENLFILFIGYILDVVTTVIVGDVTASAGQIYFLFFCISLFIKAFINAFNVRFGSDIGKTALGISVVLVFGLIALWFLFGDISGIMNMEKSLMDLITEFLNDGAVIWIMAILPYIAVAAYYISYRISVNTYRKGVESYAE